MVVVKDVILNVTGSTRKIDTELDALSTRLRGLDNQDVAIRVKTESLQAKRDLGQLREDLRSIDRTSVSPEVNLRLDRATLEVDKFEKRLDDLGKKKAAPAAIAAEINTLRGSIQRVGASAVSAGADIERAMKRAEAATRKQQKAADDAAKAAKKAADQTREVEVRSVPTGAAGEEDQRRLSEITDLAEDARQAVMRVRDVVADVGEGEEIRINVDDSEAAAKLALLRQRLEAMDGENAEPKVRVAVATALAQLAILDERLNAIGRRTISIDTRGSTMRELANMERGVMRLGSTVAGAGTTALKSFGETVGNTTQFLKQLTPIVNGAAGILVVKLAPALVAVAGGLVGAAAGAAALGAAFAAMAGPVVAIVIATLVRLQKVLEVVKLRDAAKDAASRKSAEGSRAAAQAAEQRRDAEDSLADTVRAAGRAEEASAAATRNVATQKAAAYRAMEDAAEAASDAIRGIADADLSLDEANLNYRQAKADLADYRDEIGLTGTAIDQVFKKFTDVSVDFSSGAFRKALTGAGGTGDDAGDLELERRVLAVRRARQNEADATDAVGDARRDATRAGQDEAQFLRRGIRAYEPYTAAVQAEKDAQEAVAQAHRTVLRSRRNLNNVIKQGDLGADDAEKAKQKYDELSGAEKRLADLLPALKKGITDAFGPATEGVLNGLIGAAESLPGLLDGVKGKLGGLGDAIGTSIGDLADALGGDRVTGAINYFTDNARIAVPKVTGVFKDLTGAIGEIAIQAMPAAQDALDRLGGYVDRFKQNAASGKTVPYVTEFTQDLESAMDVIGSAIDLFLEFGKAVSPAFRDIAGWLKDMADRATEWLRSAEGQKKVKQFFEDTLPAVKQFVGFLLRLAAFFLNLWQIASPILDGMFSAFNDILDIVNWVLDKIAGFLSNPALRAVRYAIGQLLAFGTIGRVMRIAGAVVKWMIGLLGRLGGVGPAIGRLAGVLIRPFRSFSGTVQRILSNLPGRVGEFFSGLPGKIAGAVVTTVAAFATIGDDMLHALIDGLTASGQWIWDKLTGLVNGIVDFVKGVLGIHSPSKVFMDIGRAMIEGLIKGFTEGDAAKVVGKAILGLVSKAPSVPLEIGKAIVGGGWNLAKSGAHAVGLASGGLVTGRTFAEIGEGRHHEAVLPLSQRVMRRLGQAIASQMSVGAGAGMLSARMPAIATSGSDRGRSIHVDKIILPPAPGGGIPDARYQAVQLAKEFRRRGGGGS